ncbi:hypothetical protein HPB48_027127 [Haemaphysalis longicornis]|uniref:Uncharacterized protein n=1 Tax=Haemaphysalis longicornis TaxID=44386 RepID=A0A9J6HDW5_HAELO|nr:hypothetical protein HPB48_027127 [Haemaphysalis longicornis]
MKQDNAAMSEEKVEQSLARLPDKQWQQVQACCQASKRGGTPGMKYTKEWVLECTLRWIKSPRLYEQIHRHNIMVLTRNSCRHRPPEIFQSE